MPEILLDKKTDALLVIDVQNDFCMGGALEVPGADQVVAPTNSLMHIFSTVVCSQNWLPRNHQSFATVHKNRAPFEYLDTPYGHQVLWPEHCVQGTLGAEFHPSLCMDQADLIIRKGLHPHIGCHSAFFENDKRTSTGLSGFLHEKGIKRLFLTGLAFDYCVAFSALDGLKEGFEVIIMCDATRAMGGPRRDHLVRSMRDEGVELSSTQAVIWRW